MKWRSWIFSVLLLAACQRKAPLPVFAPTVADTWHLRMTQTFPPGSAPEFIGKQRVRTWWFGGLIGLSSLTMLFGLVGAQRAFRRQQELSEMKSNFVSSVSSRALVEKSLIMSTDRQVHPEFV